MTFEFKGFEKFEDALDKLPEALNETVKALAMELRVKAMQKTPVATGHLTRAWSSIDYLDGGYSFGNTAIYAPVLDKGRYPGVGPRTVQTGEGIFSKQAPQGMIQPLVEDAELAERIKEIFMAKMNEALR